MMYKIHSLEIEADGMDKIDEKGIRGGGGVWIKGKQRWRFANYYWLHNPIFQQHYV